MFQNAKTILYVIAILVIGICIILLVSCGQPQNGTKAIESPIVTEAPTTITFPPTTTTTIPPTTTTPPTTAYVPPTTVYIPSTTVPAPVETVAPVSDGLPPDEYWDRMAQCETGGNWAHFPYGTWTGGLGIYNQTWIGWGGGEFAPTAGQATREQQIIVANRIATLGYGNLGPAGYSAWGCLSAVGYP